MCIELNSAIRSHGATTVTTTIIICKPHRPVIYTSTKTIRDCPYYKLLPAKSHINTRYVPCDDFEF